MKNEKDEVRKSINTLKKLFAYIPDEHEQKNVIPEDKLVGYMDRTNVIMIVPKTYFFKTLLTQDFDVTESKIPFIDYSDKYGAGYYSADFLNLILPLLKNTTGEGVEILCAKEMPIILETKEVKVIVAPRVKCD